MSALDAFRQKYPAYNDVDDKVLADALHEKFYSDMPIEDYYSQLGMGEKETSLFDDVVEFGQRTLGSAATQLSQVPSGLQERFFGEEGFGEDDQELVERNRRVAQNISDFFGYDEEYEGGAVDFLSGAIGGALPSYGTALAGAGAGLLFGGPVGALIGGGLGLLGASAVGAGANVSAGMEETARAVELGRIVSDEDYEDAMRNQAFIGLSEGLPVGREVARVFRFLSKTAAKDPKAVKTITDYLVSAAKQGTAEAFQEAAAGLASNANLQAYINPDIGITDSLASDLGAGGVAGAFFDVALNLATRKSRLAGLDDPDEVKPFPEELVAAEQELRDGIDAAEAARRERLSGRLETPAEPDPEVIGESLNSLLDQDEPTADDYKAFGQGVVAQMGDSFPTEPVFEIVQNDNGNFQIQDTSGQTYGREVTPQERVKLHPALTALNAQTVEESIFQNNRMVIEESAEDYSPEQTRTLHRLGRIALGPESLSYSAEAANYAGGTVPEKGFLPSLSPQEIIKNDIPRSQQTIAQRINVRRIKNNLPTTNRFALSEIRREIGNDVGRLADYESGTFRVDTLRALPFQVDGKFAVLPEAMNADGQMEVVGDYIFDRPATAAEKDAARSQGKRAPKRVKFTSVADASAYAAEVNRAKDSVGIPIKEIMGDPEFGVEKIRRILDQKNISSDVNSKEIKQLVALFTGRKLRKDQTIGDLTAAEGQLLYLKLSQLPRLNDPTKIPEFKLRPYTANQIATAKEYYQANGKDISRAELEYISGKPMADSAYKEVTRRAKQGAPQAQVDQEPIAALPAPSIAPDTKKILADAINRRLKALGLSDISGVVTDLVRDVERDADGNIYLSGVAKGADETVEGGYSRSGPKVIQVALDAIMARAKKPEDIESAVIEVLNHEIVHALRELDVITQQELQLLERLTTKYRKPDTNQTYAEWAAETYAGDTAVNISEEAVAEMIRDGISGRIIIDNKPAKLSGKPRSIFNRIVKFFRGLFDTAKEASADYESFTQFINDLESGAIGERQRGQVRTLYRLEQVAGQFINRRGPAGVATPQAQAKVEKVKLQIPESDELMEEAGIDDMMFSRRLERAEEQGFDTSAVYYHGSMSPDIKRFKGRTGMGVIAGHFTRSRPLADTFAAGVAREDEAATLYPVFLRKFIADNETGKSLFAVREADEVGALQNIADTLDKPFAVVRFDHPQLFQDLTDYFKGQLEIAQQNASFTGTKLRSETQKNVASNYLEGRSSLDETAYNLAEIFHESSAPYSFRQVSEEPDGIDFEELEVLAPYIKEAGFAGYRDVEEVGGPYSAVAIFDPADVKGVFAEYDPTAVPEGARYEDDIMFSRRSDAGGLSAREMFSGTDPDMFNRETGEVDYRLRHKSRKVVVDMPIDMFLHLAASMEGARADSEELVRELAEGGKRFDRIPLLALSFESGKPEHRYVYDHDGRHRARQLKSMGYDTVPVMVIDASIRWDSQSEGDFDRVKTWPRSILNQDQDFVFPMFLDRNANVRYGRFGPQSEDDIMFSRRRVGTTGQYVGAPKGIDTPSKLRTLIKTVRGLAEEGEYGRFWYERSGRQILDLVGGDKSEAEKIVQAIAITSAQTPVPSNFQFALQAYYQHKNGEPIRTGIFTSDMSTKLENMFNGVPWEGRKTNNFYINLMREIDPTLVQGVTNDLWMMRAFQFFGDSPSDAQYNFVEAETKKLANQLGWEPQQVQAAIWVALKSRMESKEVKAKTDETSEKKGWIRFDRNRKGKKVRVILDEANHRKNWFKTAMGHSPTLEEREAAKFDYKDAAQASLAQSSWESIPSRSSGHMAGIFNAPIEQKLDYHKQMSMAFLDDQGNDIIARELGLASPGSFEAPGYFEGLASPGSQTQAVLPKKFKGQPLQDVERAAVELIEAYSAAVGILLKQDGVGYHRPFYKKGLTESQANAIDVDFGRPLTMEEMTEVGNLYAEETGDAYAAPVSTPQGVRFINFNVGEAEAEVANLARMMRETKDPREKASIKKELDEKRKALKKTNKQFQDDIKRVLDRANLPDYTAKLFVSYNGYIGNDWLENRNGEGYLENSRLAGRPDLQRRVSDIVTQLAPRIEAVETEFADKYGWSPREDLNTAYRARPASPEIKDTDAGTLGEGQVAFSRRSADRNVERSSQDAVNKVLKYAEDAKPDVAGAATLRAGPFAFAINSGFADQNGYAPTFTTPSRSWFDHVVFQVQDKLTDLKAIEEAINEARKARGEPPLAIQESAYIGEETIAGKLGEFDRRFQRNELQPLINDMSESGVSLDEMDEFLVLRHAIERNERVRRINPSIPDAGSGEWNGQKLTDDYVKTQMLAKYGMRWNDKKGEWEGGNDRAKTMSRLASRVDKINSTTLAISERGGLLTKQDREFLDGFFKYYTPLRGIAQDEDIAAETNKGTAGSGGSLSIVGKEVKRLMGRQTEAISPLATIVSDRGRQTARAVKNVSFGKRLVDLIKNNPNDEVWQLISPEDPRYKRAFDTSYTYVGPDKSRYGERKSDISKEGDKKNWVKRVRVIQDPVINPYGQELLGVKVDGEQYYVHFANPSLRKAAINLDAESVGYLVEKLNGFTRFMSYVNTSLNPEFVMGNFARDVQTAIYNIIGEQTMEGGKAVNAKKIVGQVLKRTLPSVKVFYKGYRDPSSLTGQDAIDFREFMQAGAKTDWFHSKPPEQQKKNIELMVSMANGTFRGNAAKGVLAVKDFIDDGNAAVENGVRLATFVAARDAMLAKGIDRDTAVQQAATLAKNLTVNFNRRGNSGQLLNGLYLFFNASVQGTVNTLRGMNVFDPNSSRTKQAVVGGIIGFGALMAALAESLMDEEELEDIPEYIRDRNMIIPDALWGGDPKKYTTIPLPYGYNVFYNLGENAYLVSSGALSKEDAAVRATNVFLGSFNPLGTSSSETYIGSLLKTATPQILKPALELTMNENYFGAPIYPPDNPFGGFSEPLSRRSFKNTAPLWKNIAEGVSTFFGGNESEAGAIEFPPDAMSYLIGYFGGGAGTFAERTFLKVPAALLDETAELEVRDIPFVRRIRGEINAQPDTEKYYERRETLAAKMNQANKVLRGAERTAYMRDNRAYFNMVAASKAAEKTLKNLRSSLREIQKLKTISPDRAIELAQREKALQDRIDAVIERFNNRYDEVVGKDK